MNEVTAHAAIGRAVIACQALEVLFALCVRLGFGQSAAQQLSDITPLEKNFSKPPMKALLKQLRDHIEVSPEFETRIEDIIERRHKLIHRWGIEENLPATPQQYQRIGEFAASLEKDAVEMSHFLHAEFVACMKKFPELAQPKPGEEKAWEAVVPEALRTLSVRKSQ
jgi:hypothetical protein